MTSPLSSRRRSKTPPPGETGQEGLYLRSLSDRQVVVNIKLRDGETVRGWIEYFDDSMLRLTREDQPNLFIYKHQIRSISEAGKRRVARYETGGGPARGRRGRGGPVTDAAETANRNLILFLFPGRRRLRAKRVRCCANTSSQGVETEYKGDVDIVTVADRAAEKLIRDAAGRGVSGARHLWRRGHARAHGRRVSLVRGPAGWNY